MAAFLFPRWIHRASALDLPWEQQEHSNTLLSAGWATVDRVHCEYEQRQIGETIGRHKTINQSS